MSSSPTGYIVLDFTSTSQGAEGHRVYRSSEPMSEGNMPPSIAQLPRSADQYLDYDFADESAVAENLYYRVSDFWRDQRRISEEMSIPNPANVLSPDSPTWLFGDGESGFENVLAIDTLFPDTAGTTPVSAYGDTIALATNLADDGPDMAQATGAARPAYGRMPVSGVRNNLGQSHELDGAYYTQDNVVLTDSSTPAPSGDNWYHIAVDSATAATAYYPLINAFPVPDIGPNRFSFYAKGGELGFVKFGVWLNATNYSAVTVDLSTGVVEDRVLSSGSLLAIANVEIEPEGDGYRISGTLEALTTGGTPRRIYILPSSDGVATGDPFASQTGDGASGIYIASLQYEDGEDTTSYQKVTAAYDITQPGTQSVPIAYMDTSDDNFSWTLPAGTYHLFIAGDLGCYFDTVEHAGGEFKVGPTSWTGGPAGAITTLIGQRHVTMPVILGREFTQFEREQLVAYAMAKGAPGVWEHNANLVTNGTFPASVDGWTANVNAAIVWDSGELELTTSGSASTYQDAPISVTSGEIYYAEVDMRLLSGNGMGLNVRGVPSLGGDVIVNSISLASPATTTKFRSVAPATSTDATAYIQLVVSGSGVGYYDNIVLNKLTLNTDPLA